jgi:hypothetical protein
VLAFAILLLLWGLGCPDRPCKWMLLLSGEAALGTGIVLVNFAHCCPVLSAIGLGLTAAGMALMLAWRRECGLTWCALWMELTQFNFGLLAPILVGVAFTLGLIQCDLPGITARVLTAGVQALIDLGVLAVITKGWICRGDHELGERMDDPARESLTRPRIPRPPD